MKIFCAIQRFAGYLVANSFKRVLELKNDIVELKDELCIFFYKKTSVPNFADLFCDDRWLSVVCYLADIFCKIMMLSLSFKVKVTSLGMNEKLTAFHRKIMIWRENFEKGCLEMFPLLCDFVAENYVCVPLKTLISVHLKNLETEFSNLFKKILQNVSVGFECKTLWLVCNHN